MKRVFLSQRSPVSLSSGLYRQFSSVKVDRHVSSEELASRIPKDGKTLGDFVRSGSSTPVLETPTEPWNGRSFHIRTFGCQMNVNDSDIVRAVLLERGYIEATSEEEADIWLTNTCAIRDKAEQRVWQRLKQLRNQRKKMHTQKKKDSDDIVVGLLGCMAERLQDEIIQEKLADLVVGPDAYRDLPRLLDELLPPTDNDDEFQSAPYAMNVQLNIEETYEDIVPVRASQSNPFSAFVSIQRGCSNRCSFCIVPFTRGQERSRPLQSIVDEVQQLVEEQNVKEVVLLGQNVNSYHDRSEEAMLAKPLATTPGLSNSGFRNRTRRPTQGGYTFVDLVEQIADISPELRVRFTSPHPKDYPTELLHCMAERPNVCNQLHLPAQSGASTMLKRMKRGYTREAYLELIDNVRTIIPDVALSSDFIAGFCDETDEEHADTVSLLEAVEFEQAFLFAYSLREKTLAHRTMQDNVPAAIKQQRLQELIDTFRSRVHSKNERVEVGQWRLVLLEGPAKRQIISPEGSNQPQTTWHGRTDQNKRILFTVNELPNGEAVTREGSFLSSLSQHANLSMTNTFSIQAPVQTTTARPGDYAVVEVTEAKGHTLRGRLLCRTTLAGFAEFDNRVWSKLDLTARQHFQQSLQTHHEQRLDI